MIDKSVRKRRPMSGPIVGHAPLEYDPLEYLLAAIVDAHPIKGKKRLTRIETAYEALTGLRYKRHHSPDSDLGQAIFQYGEQDYENRSNGARESEGGPRIETEEDERFYADRTTANMVKRVVNARPDLDPNGNLETDLNDYMQGVYSVSVVRAGEDAGILDAMSRFSEYDAGFEEELFNDLCRVRDSLAKYGVRADLSRPFWRIRNKPIRTE